MAAGCDVAMPTHERGVAMTTHKRDVAMTTHKRGFQVTRFSFERKSLMFVCPFSCFDFVCILILIFVHDSRGQLYGTNEVTSCNEYISISRRMNGTIQSTGYPNPYPAERFCTTQIQGDSRHRIVIQFDDFYLHFPLGQHHRKQSSCAAGLDTLYIFDGLEKEGKVLGEYCGGRKPPRLISSGSHLTLKLKSYTSGVEARGYSAKYSFVSICHPRDTPRQVSFNSCNIGNQDEGNLCEFEFDTSKQIGGTDVEVTNCNEFITITQNLNGTIQSVGYPCPYPEKRFCSTQLRGDSKHRIILQFEDFYLSHPLGERHRKPASCAGLDTLIIYDGLEEDEKVLGEYCGGRRPPQLMSSGPHLTLKLTSYISSNDSRGYRAKYYFVSNFGIVHGIQNKKGVCEFKYDSDEKGEGKITSPNPGGLYPANTNCTYHFEGTFLERVYFQFHFFDMEGIEPCTTRSGSDYLEFSSTPGYDPCPARRCGQFTPQEIVSEGSLFRITFSSNDRLSGLGFAASYKFVTDEQLPEWASYLKSNTAKSSLKIEFSLSGLGKMMALSIFSVLFSIIGV